MLLKFGSLDLGKDTATWYGKIQSFFESSHSSIIRAGGKPHIQFTYKDLTAGMAIGSLTVAVHGHILVFPIVIRGGQLEDFDTYFDQSERRWKFSSEENLDSVVNGYSPMVGLSSRPSVDKSEQMIRDPASEHTRIVTASRHELQKMAAVLDSQPDLYLSAPEAFVNRLHSFLAEADHFHKQPQKMAEYEEKHRSTDDLFRHWDVAEIRKTDLNKYAVRMAALGVNEAVSLQVPSDGVRALAYSFGKRAEKLLDTLDAEDGLTISRGDGEPAHIFNDHVDTTPMNQTDTIGSAGTYDVVDSNGRRRTGNVYPVIGWEGDRTGMWVFVDSFEYAYQDKIAGERSGSNMIPPRGQLAPERKGVFVEDRGGDIWCTPPVIIKSISTVNDGTMILAEDLSRSLGKVNLVLTGSYKQPAAFVADVAPEMYRPEAKNVFLPSGLAFIEIGQSIELMKSVDGVAKVASALREPCTKGVRFEVEKTAAHFKPFKVYDRSNHIYKVAMFEPAEKAQSGSPILSGSYAVTDVIGLDFILKTANMQADLNKLSSMKPGEHATVCGGGIDKAGKALTEAGRDRIKPKNFALGDEKYPIHDISHARNALTRVSQYGDPKEQITVRSKVHEKYPSLAAEYKQASVILQQLPGWEGTLKLARAYAEAEPMAYRLKDILSEANWPIVKTATDWNTDDSLNSIFKLNLVTPDNVTYFSDMVPAFDAVEEALVKLLLVSRLTPVGVEEELIRDTLEGVSTIKSKFRGMKPMVKP